MFYHKEKCIDKPGDGRFQRAWSTACVNNNARRAYNVATMC